MLFLEAEKGLLGDKPVGLYKSSMYVVVGVALSVVVFPPLLVCCVGYGDRRGLLHKKRRNQ